MRHPIRPYRLARRHLPHRPCLLSPRGVGKYGVAALATRTDTQSVSADRRPGMLGGTSFADAHAERQ
jgi:hypothetical protein